MGNKLGCLGKRYKVCMGCLKIGVFPSLYRQPAIALKPSCLGKGSTRTRTSLAEVAEAEAATEATEATEVRPLGLQTSLRLPKLPLLARPKPLRKARKAPQPVKPTHQLSHMAPRKALHRRQHPLGLKSLPGQARRATSIPQPPRSLFPECFKQLKDLVQMPLRLAQRSTPLLHRCLLQQSRLHQLYLHPLRPLRL